MDYCRRSSFLGLGVTLATALLVACAGANTGSFDAGGNGKQDLTGGGLLDLLAVTDLTVVASTDLAGSNKDFTVASGDLVVVPGPDMVVVADLVPPGKIPGDNCTTDNECASQLCKPVVVGGNSVCVIACTAQAECTPYLNLFCEATTVGATAGWCIPRSPTHCTSCTTDSDCGVLTERCLVGPGDIAKACHIDCSLAGTAACPSDYNCSAVTDGTTQRMLCVPKNTPVCLDAIGGFCDRATLPQFCSRTNSAGNCSGQRTCLSVSKRFNKCDAAAPTFRTSCTQQNPAGCMLAFDPTILNTAQNCGSCGNPCPGLNTTNADVQCTNPSTSACSFACKGENYDVNQSTGDGCEVGDVPTVNHIQTDAAYVNDLPCHDGSSNPNISGRIPSDSRTHNPQPTGFSTTTGSAPDWFYVNATGGACFNDFSITLQMSGSTIPTCYKLTMITNNGTHTCQAASTGACTVSGGTGSYSDNTTIYFHVDKTCAASSRDNPTYTIKGHL